MYRLLLLLVVVIPVAGCLRQPSDEAQIRALVRASVDALNRQDVAAAYRLTDLDFRAVCPRDRYAAVLAEDRQALGPAAQPAVDAIRVRHIRAEAEVSISGAERTVDQRWRFIRDGGRWYRYEDAARCGVTE